MDNDINNLVNAKMQKITRDLKAKDALEKANKNPIEFFAHYNINLPTNFEYQIAQNDDENYYFVIPYVDSNLTDDDLTFINAAGKDATASTLATLGSALTFFCVACASSAGLCAGSWGSISSASSFACAGSVSSKG